MKKLAIGCTLFLMVLILVPQQSPAQDVGMNFYINFGVITDDSFSFNDWLWSGGAQLDLHIGPLFMLSPECDVIIYRFEFDPVILAPGVIANIKLSNFFLGAGLTKWFLIGSSVPTFESDFALKANIGLRTSNLKFTLYGISYFDGFLDYLIIGLTLGFGF